MNFAISGKSLPSDGLFGSREINQGLRGAQITKAPIKGITIHCGKHTMRKSSHCASAKLEGRVIKLMMRSHSNSKQLLLRILRRCEGMIKQFVEVGNSTPMVPICRMEIGGAFSSKLGVETCLLKLPRVAASRIVCKLSQHRTPAIEAAGDDIFASLCSVNKNINTYAYIL